MTEKTQDGERTAGKQWDQIRSAIKAKWSAITDEDLQGLDADSNKLVSLVTRKTGLPIHEAEAAVDELASSSEGLLSRIASKAKEMAADAAHQVSRPAQAAGESARNVFSESPSISVATAFGVGLAVGLGLVLLLHAPEPKTAWTWR